MKVFRIISITIILITLSICTADAWDKWNRFREKHVDPIGDTFLGTSTREQEIIQEKKRQHEADMQQRQHEHQKKLAKQKAEQEKALAKQKAEQEMELKKSGEDHKARMEALKINSQIAYDKEKEKIIAQEKAKERAVKTRNTILAALIGVIGVILGALIPVLVNKRKAKKE